MFSITQTIRNAFMAALLLCAIHLNVVAAQDSTTGICRITCCDRNQVCSLAVFINNIQQSDCPAIGPQCDALCGNLSVSLGLSFAQCSFDQYATATSATTSTTIQTIEPIITPPVVRPVVGPDGIITFVSSDLADLETLPAETIFDPSFETLPVTNGFTPLPAQVTGVAISGAAERGSFMVVASAAMVGTFFALA